MGLVAIFMTQVPETGTRCDCAGEPRRIGGREYLVRGALTRRIRWATIPPRLHAGIERINLRWRITRLGAQWFILFLVFIQLSGCASLMSSMTSQMAGNLADTIANSKDVQTVKEGIPAYLLLIESFLRNSPNDPKLLMSAARLNDVFGLLVGGKRAKLLTADALTYGLRAACVSHKASCDMRKMPFDKFKRMVNGLHKEDVPAMYAAGVAWVSWIQAHSGDWNAIGELGRVKYLMARIVDLDDSWDHGGPELYLGGLETTLPASMGGHPEKARKHFERAIQISNGKYLMDKVVYAEQYAKLTFNKKLYDRLLKEVLAANPVVPGMTLANEIAQQKAKTLLAQSKDYF